MPNELDHLWKIDIKKASAVPPLIVRERLKAVIDKVYSLKEFKEAHAHVDTGHKKGNVILTLEH